MIGLSGNENRYRPEDTQHMPSKRTIGHAAHISELRISLTMRHDLLFNVSHVYNMATLFIKEFVHVRARM